MKRKQSLKLPLLVFLITVTLLSFVQVKVDNPMLLLERFLTGGGWVEKPFSERHRLEAHTVSQAIQ